MKKYFNNFVSCTVILAAFLSSCDVSQEVSPIDPPTNNAIATITPRGNYSVVEEGDILIFDITVDKLLAQPLDFGIVIDTTSTADADDVGVSGGTLDINSYSTTLFVEILADRDPETTIETLTFNVNASDDYAYNFQLNPASDDLEVTVTIRNYDFVLDWSEGMYEGEDLCEAGVNLDVYVKNMDASNEDGKTGACPFEAGTLATLPDGTYDIYVDLYYHEIPTAASVDIPWVLTFSSDEGDPVEIEGTYSSDDVVVTLVKNEEGEEEPEFEPASVVVGQVVIANGTYTVLDADGTTLGTL